MCLALPGLYVVMWSREAGCIVQPDPDLGSLLVFGNRTRLPVHELPWW
jgi:hypothetical protein